MRHIVQVEEIRFSSTTFRGLLALTHSKTALLFPLQLLG